VIVILGPTAVGKTETAIQLAMRVDGEIISADSRLFYRGMDIGTAKPSPEELRLAPHHLIDVTTPDQPWSLALFQRKARQTIAEIQSRGRLPFLVGGTGQYIRAVTEEWTIPPAGPEPALRAALEAWTQEIGPEGLYRRLAVLDPEAAANIDPRNQRRTVRALEVILLTGRRFSEQRLRRSSPSGVLQLGLFRPRPELYARIDARIDAMLQAGLVAEVQNLLAQGYSPHLPPFSAIGYREVIAYLQGQISLEEAVRQMKHNTRVFVRRQANWFKETDPHIRWFDASAPDALETVLTLIRAKLPAGIIHF
jgi:tRNA dimethylallyltransferase